jgi:hypothetical protein
LVPPEKAEPPNPPPVDVIELKTELVPIVAATDGIAG